MARAFADTAFFDAFLDPENKPLHQLWPHILRFNAHPCYDQPTLSEFLWPQAELESWLAQLPDCLRTSLPEPGKPVFFWDFKEDSRKLALLDDQRLERLAMVSGVTLHAKDLAMVVERRARQELCQALGETLLEYAVGRGQYQTGLAGAIMADLDRDLSLAERCRLHGWLALHFCAQPWPEVLRLSLEKRLFSLSHGKSFADYEPVDDDAWQTLWRMLKRCLLREVAPSWLAFFSA
ncbi:MAG: SctK family type III secretion system sorting platform protein [Desulfovibrio sp.]|nr:SctK family type III secretion system sorting platform protein [Desulfovibrio sp.]